MPPEIDRYFLQPGDVLVPENDSVLTTILGSCVSVLLWDRRIKVGGMNHFVLPEAPSGTVSCRYGDVAIRTLFRKMIQHGSSMETMGACILGGGNPVRELRKTTSIGSGNSDIAMRMMKQYRIPILMQDTGGDSGRKICFDTASGAVDVQSLARVRHTDWHPLHGENSEKTEIQLPFSDRRTPVRQPVALSRE